MTQADAAEALPGKTGPLASLQIPDFRLLLAGTTLGNAAQWIQQVTLSWLVYAITGSGTMLGSVNLVRGAAALGMVAVTGTLIDRLNHRSLMVAVNTWLFAIALVLGLALIHGHPQVSWLFVFTALAGIANSVNQALRQVLVFDVVPRNMTPNAMALVQTGWAVMRLLGPAMGGFLILWYGTGGNFIIQAGAYALIALAIMRIHVPDRQDAPAHASALRNIREGVGYIARQPVTRAFTLMGLVLPLCIIPVFAVLPPIYASQVYGGKADVLGMLLGAVGGGAVVGGMVTASLGSLEHRGRLLLCAMFLLSMSLIGFAFSSKLWLGLILLAIAGFFEIIFITTNQTLLQLSISDEMRGRVTSVVNLNMALSPIGGMVAGVGSDYFGGPRTITLILCGIAATITLFALVLSPTIRNYRLKNSIWGT